MSRCECCGCIAPYGYEFATGICEGCASETIESPSELTTLRAENERLREALKALIEKPLTELTGADWNRAKEVLLDGK